MAVYFLNIKTIGRSSGGSAVGAAAYRAGERIHDERTGRTHDHSQRLDVMHKEIVLPQEFADTDMAWARDRANLWNAAERAENRSNARVAREYLVALPYELSAAQRLNLARGFSQELADRYGFAADLAIHAPRDYPDSDPRNFHAHILATTREVGAHGLGAKTTMEMNPFARAELGLKAAIHEIFHVRERWAAVTNEALREANIDARVDHRTLEAQGVDREPRPYLPKAIFEMERHGNRSVVGERMREDYRARVEAREAARDREREERHREREAREPRAGPRDAAQSPEDIQRQAIESWRRYRESQKAETPERSVENWLRYKQAQAESESSPADSPPMPGHRHGSDHGL